MFYDKRDINWVISNDNNVIFIIKRKRVKEEENLANRDESFLVRLNPNWIKVELNLRNHECEACFRP